MPSKFVVKIIIFLIFVVLVGTPLFYLKASVYPYILSKTLFFQSLVELLFSAWLLLVFFDKRYRPKLTPLTKSLLVFLAAIFVTSIFGVDFHRSFWSTYERMFGIFTIFHLAALALVISSLGDEIPWRKLLYASLFTAALIDILSILQLNIKNLLLEEPVGRPGATFGNPTFFAGYLMFHIFIALYFLMERRRSKSKSILPYLFFAGSFILSLVVLFLTETRGDILGLVAGVLVLLVLFFFRPPALSRIEGPDFGQILRRRWIYLYLIVLILGLGAAFWATRGSSVWSSIPGIGRFRDISASSPGLQPRLVALRSAWNGFLDRPFSGFGWDNFNVVYNKYYDPRTLELSYTETRFDKPHNFFMEDLATGGIVLTLAHLALLVLLAVESLKLKDKYFGQIIVASTAAYFVRSLLIFDTIGPALILYVLLGFVDGRRKAEDSEERYARQNEKSGQTERKVNLLAACVSLGLALVVVWELNAPTAKASYWEFNAFMDLAHGRPREGIADFKKTLDFPSPYRWNFARDFSTAITEAYFYNPDTIPKEAAWQAIREMEKVAREHPHDAYNHYALVDMYNQVSDLDPDNFLNAAEKEAAIALKLSPNRQEVYFSLAKTKTLKKDYVAALDILKKALALSDKVPDAHFYYGVVAYADGDQVTGYKELKTAIAMGRKWKNFYEPRTVADFFADSGHLDEAIDLYKKALDLGPAEVETKIKLGVAYFYANQYDLAKKYLKEAGAKFDFKKSSSYPDLKPILDKLELIQ